MKLFSFPVFAIEKAIAKRMLSLASPHKEWFAQRWAQKPYRKAFLEQKAMPLVTLVAKGKTIIIVTHDSALAKRTHRTALIADGEIVNEYVARAMPTLTQDQMLWATRNATEQSFEAGSMIFTEGSSADTFYIVSKGTVDVVLPRPGQSDVIALQLGPGKFFGEMAYFHDRRRRASIRASEHSTVEVLALGYDQLTELLNQSEATREALHQVADRNEIANVQKRSAS